MSKTKESYLAAIKALGKADATSFQAEAVDATGELVYANEEKIPSFAAARALKNMMERQAGQSNGFLCVSSAGSIVRLIQNYDSDTYTEEPEQLVAQWRFFWSTDPKRAKDFMSSSTSYYSLNECCIWEGHVWQSTLSTANTWSPTEYPAGWKDLGTVEEIMAA